PVSSTRRRTRRSSGISTAVTAVDLPEERRVRLRVEDTGPGIPPEPLAAIFEPFHQLEATARDGRRGVGLGLAIVRRYVALLSGDVTVRSEVGVGTAFEVTLPYRPMSGAVVAPVASPVQTRPVRRLR